MSERTDQELLDDIQEAIHRITHYVAGMSYESFLDDGKTQDAVVRNLEILGEASKRLSTQLRESHPEIPWRRMAGTRDRLIHDYFGANFDIVWQIITVELPKLEPQLGTIRASEELHNAGLDSAGAITADSAAE